MEEEGSKRPVLAPGGLLCTLGWTGFVGPSFHPDQVPSDRWRDDAGHIRSPGGGICPAGGPSQTVHQPRATAPRVGGPENRPVGLGGGPGTRRRDTEARL